MCRRCKEFHGYRDVSGHSKPAREGRMKTATLREALRMGQRKLLMGAMNELTVNIQHSILTLAGNGWSNRRIARELGINRETVGKYLVLARSKPAISTAGPNAGRQSPLPAVFIPDRSGSDSGVECPTHLPGFGL